MSSTAGAVDRAPATGDIPAVERRLVAATLLTLLVLITGLALLLLVRRLSGAFLQPLSGLAVVGAATVLVVATAGWRWFSLSTQYPVPSTQWHARLAPAIFWIPKVVPGIASFVALASLTIPGTAAWGLGLAWLVLIAGETCQWLVQFRPILTRTSWTRLATAPAELPVTIEEPEIPAGLVQQVTRIVDGELESIHSVMRAEVVANDRLAVIHLAFCPPLAARPELTAHALDAKEAEVRITQAEAFGARIEIRLPQVEEFSRSVLIEVLGSVTGQRGS